MNSNNHSPGLFNLYFVFIYPKLLSVVVTEAGESLFVALSIVILQLPVL